MCCLETPLGCLYTLLIEPLLLIVIAPGLCAGEPRYRWLLAVFGGIAIATWLSIWQLNTGPFISLSLGYLAWVLAFRFLPEAKDWRERRHGRQQ